jgi:23S rRNA (pseudouridine1915-N3)-methyltransferase
VLKDKKGIKKYFLAEWGKEYSSGEFQNKLSLDLARYTYIDIYIGNAYGWIKDYINAEFVSLSKMTYSHEIAKVLLMEQIYRYMDNQVEKYLSGFTRNNMLKSLI